MAYTAKTFDIPALQGISERTIEEHLKLYQGYVKHVNLIEEKIKAMGGDMEANAFPIMEMRRRLGFEWGGMRNHERYFEQFEGGVAALPDGALKSAIEAKWGSFDAFLQYFKSIAMTRGVGWAMLYYDRDHGQLETTWVDEQHLGQLATAEIILGLDMWEHSYMLDYAPSEKKQYVDAFFQNLNWNVCAKRMDGMGA